jgi:hypothetical protein
MRTIGSILLIASAWSSLAYARQDTLPEVVRRQRGQVEWYVTREFSPVDLSELVRDCDLIARVVVVGESQSRLSTDERSIESDYTVRIVDRLFSRQAVQPGEAIVITKPGGAVTVDGYQVRTRERDFPDFQNGEEYVVFLKFDSSAKRYIVPFGAQGAFRNVGGVVEQVSRDTGTWNRERGPVSVLAFLEELAGIIAHR